MTPILSLFVLMSATIVALAGDELKPPIHSDDAKILKEIIRIGGNPVEVDEKRSNCR